MKLLQKSHPAAPQYEPCVLCGAATKVPADLPIVCRENYISGCGQLCEHCAGLLQGELDRAPTEKGDWIDEKGT